MHFIEGYEVNGSGKLQEWQVFGVPKSQYSAYRTINNKFQGPSLLLNLSLLMFGAFDGGLSERYDCILKEQLRKSQHLGIQERGI